MMTHYIIILPAKPKAKAKSIHNYTIYVTSATIYCYIVIICIINDCVAQ